MSETLTTDQEIAQLIGAQSEDMPTSMAVNQKQIQEEASTAGTTPMARSKYFGVYTNTSVNNQDRPFRAAIRLGSKEKANWMHLGYFKCEHVAAIAYNVAAINYFGEKGWLNPVNLEAVNQEDYDAYKKERHMHIDASVNKLKRIHAEGKQPNIVDLEANRTSM